MSKFCYIDETALRFINHMPCGFRWKQFLPYALEVQKIELTTVFTEERIAEILENDETVPYLEEYMVYMAYFKWLLAGSIRMTDAGAVIKTTDFSERPDYRDIRALRDSVLSSADFYKSKLVNNSCITVRPFRIGRI